MLELNCKFYSSSCFLKDMVEQTQGKVSRQLGIGGSLLTLWKRSQISQQPRKIQQQLDGRELEELHPEACSDFRELERKKVQSPRHNLLSL